MSTPSKEQFRFRDPSLTKRIVAQIQKLAPPHEVKFCHVCGTHEWTITHHGLRILLPETVKVIAGPGCPVCILPAAELDEAIMLALNDVTIVTYGDVIRVPASESSLQEAKASGGDVRVVYSVSDAVRMAEKEPEKDFVFLAIGFETTAPATAVEVLNKPPENLSFLVSHRLIPPAMELLLGVGDLHIDGFIAPGHVSTIIGVEPYQIFPEAYHMPTIVAGFEPMDVLFAVSMLLKQLKDGEARLENEYKRSVTWVGNVKAQQIVEKVFRVVGGRWRGLGRIPSSALALKPEFAPYDARAKYNVKIGKSRDLLPGCLCHLVMIGKINPPECPLFMKDCKPPSPRGACMVSIEGTCRIWAKHAVIH
ncbi:MAG: hydrogenase formation protein HypD [Candidatus Bathyarchaeota archaeon]|nr:MAG: hydrogenase formation protein HypD [Candidatus Bathyarchaeota archaeon]